MHRVHILLFEVFQLAWSSGWSAGIVIDIVKVQNLLAQIFLGPWKDALRLHGVLANSSKFQSYLY